MPADTLTRDYRGDRLLIVTHQVVVNCLRYLFERLDEARVLDGDRPTDARTFSERLARVLTRGLRKHDAFTSAVAPPEGSPAYFGSRFTDLNGVSWQEINLRSLSQFPEFLSISA